MIRGSAAVLARSISGLRPQASGSQAHGGPPFEDVEDLEEFRREVNTLLGQRCESYACIPRQLDPAMVDAEMVRGCSSGRIRQASRSLPPPTSHASLPQGNSHPPPTSALPPPISHPPPPPTPSTFKGDPRGGASWLTGRVVDASGLSRVSGVEGWCGDVWYSRNFCLFL